MIGIVALDIQGCSAYGAAQQQAASVLEVETAAPPTDTVLAPPAPAVA